MAKKIKRPEQGTIINPNPFPMPAQPANPLNAFGVDTNQIRIPQNTSKPINQPAKTSTNRISSNQAQIDEINKAASMGTYGTHEDRMLIASRRAAEAGLPPPEMQAGIINPQAEPQVTSPEKLQIVGNIGQEVIPGEQQSSRLNVGMALAQAGEQALLGAGAGAVVTGGNPLGAGVGLGLGFVRGFVNNLKKQRSEQITASGAGLKKRTTNILAYTTDINQGGNWREDTERINLELAGIDRDYSQLKLDSQSKILGEDATSQMAAYEIFYEQGGTRERLIYETQQALLNPNPSKNLMSLSDFSDS